MDCQIRTAEKICTLKNHIAGMESAKKEAAEILRSITDYGRHFWERSANPQRKIRLLDNLERIARGKI